MISRFEAMTCRNNAGWSFVVHHADNAQAIADKAVVVRIAVV